MYRGGEILIDGTNIKDVSITDLRSLIGYVNQEAMFNDSFYNNITFGVENATKEQVIEAAKIANAHDFIMESEQGYDTNIGDRGCRFQVDSASDLHRPCHSEEPGYPHLI